MASTPPRMRAILDEINATVSADLIGPTLPLPQGLTQDVLVPLAGFLLEFPVAYVVPSEQQASGFLGDVPLDVYECDVLRGNNAHASSETHVLFQFSCPCNVGLDHEELSLGAMSRRVCERFASRLDSLGANATLKVKHYIVTQDRVAL